VTTNCDRRDADAARRRRAFEIAANARRYRLLGRRPEFLSAVRDDRIRHALAEEPPGELHPFDAAIAIGTSELDRFAGHTVALLNNSGRRSVAPLLDAIGILDPYRVAAIYFALEPQRRKVMREDPACAFHVQQVEREVIDAEAMLDDLLSATEGTTAFGYALARLDVSCADEPSLERRD
jgi:hypothetical protein